MNGNLIGAVNTPTLGSAPGVWDIEELKLAQQQNSWPRPMQPDPDFEYVSLLLSGETAVTNGAQNNTFQDSSINNFTITRNGNTTQGSFSPYLPNWSNNFDGTGDYLTIPYSASTAQWWDADYTIEMWVYNITNAASGTNGTALQVTYGIPTTAETYWAFGTQATGALYFYYFNGGAVTNAFSTATVALNTWTHIAMVYNNTTGTIKGYISGVEVFSVAKQGTPQAASGRTFNIGISQNTTYNGYISNLRVVRGSLVYTGNFTPSTTPLTAVTNTSLLVAKSNRFIDNSTNNFTITRNGDTRITPFSPFSSFAATKGYVPATYGGSAYFDGTGDYLTAVGSGSVVRSSGSFTIEGWYYPTSSASSFRAVYSSGTGYATAGRLYQNNTSLTFYWTASSSVSGSIPWTLNSWNHFAVTWDGTTTKVYVNGQQTISSTSPTYSGTVDISVGESTYSPFGYISNFRIANSVIYTSNFTPPTSPLTAISGTQLLTNFTNGGIIDSAALNVAETVGNAQVSTSVRKYGSGSYYFDGTGDYLIMPSNALLSPRTGDFTIECWLYLTAVSGEGTLFYVNVNSGINLFLNIGSNWGIATAGVGVNNYFGTPPTQNTWNHLAVARNGSTIRAFINGVQVFSGSNTSNYAQGTAIIGSSLSFGTITGYVSDFRFTNGLARYTANFTLPISSLPTF